jgi:hypothetical protein
MLRSVGRSLAAEPADAANTDSLSDQPAVM